MLKEPSRCGASLDKGVKVLPAFWLGPVGLVSLSFGNAEFFVPRHPLVPVVLPGTHTPADAAPGNLGEFDPDGSEKCVHDA